MRFLLILSLCVCPNLYAYPSSHSIGIGLGYTWTQAVFNDGIRTLGVTREVPSYSNVDHAKWPFSIHYAIAYNPYYGIEFGLLDFGSIAFDKLLTTYDDSTGTTTSTSLRSADIHSQGYYLQHKVSLPITSTLNVYGKAGLILGATEYSEREILKVFSEDVGNSTTLQLNSSRQNFTDLHFSLGFAYQWKSNWRIALQINRLHITHKAEAESFTHWLTLSTIEYRY